MFYSHTFLARKGPLGTVWCAAHLQHRLRKSHYIQTNVSTTVEKIMYPEVPIALRMSSHLLLGVVRIYSKQVDYFFEDCNEIRITINRVFTTVTVDLPNDATQAQFNSVTLPEKFDLDTMELDDNNLDWQDSSHLKSLDEITLTEQIPTGRDPYIIINFDEHDLRSSSLVGDTPTSGSTPMEEDNHPHDKLDATAAGFKSPSRSNNLGDDGNRTPKNLQSIEIMRDARHGGFDFNNSPILPDRADPDKFLEDQINRDKEMVTPVREVVFPDARFSSSQNPGDIPSPQHMDSEMPFVDRSPELELQPTPEMEIQPTPPAAKPKVARKKRQHYDMETVLTNEFVKNTLDDTSDILRTRGSCPKSSLSAWKRNNRRRLGKEGFIVEPYVTGCCAALQYIYTEDFAQNHLVTIQETHQGANDGGPSLSMHGDNNDEIEVLRNNDLASPERSMPFSTSVPSPSGKSHRTPENANSRVESEDLEMTDANETLPKSNMGASGNPDSEFRSPEEFYDNDMQFDNTNLSVELELMPSAGDLEFLEQEYNSPAGPDGTPGIGTTPGNQSTSEHLGLSSRTRAVAQYLKNQTGTSSPGNLEESSEELSLNKILDGKPRKIAARLFYETLVLKSYGLVDVRQEKPYDDIALMPTPKMSKEQFT